MLREFTLPSTFDGIVPDYTPQFNFPNSFDVPLVCSKIIKLYYGHISISNIEKGTLNLAMPHQHIPPKYSEFLDNNSQKIEYSTHLEAAQHIIFLTMTSISRDADLVTQFLKQSRLYDSKSITDDWIEKQIKNYVDPRYIHYTLKVMLLEDKFQIINNPKYRLSYEDVYQRMVYAAKDINRIISSKKQLTAGLNRLIKKEKSMTCIVKNRQFGKATRFLGVEGLYPSFFYKRIPSPTEIRQRAKLIG